MMPEAGSGFAAKTGSPHKPRLSDFPVMPKCVAGITYLNVFSQILIQVSFSYESLLIFHDASVSMLLSFTKSSNGIRRHGRDEEK